MGIEMILSKGEVEINFTYYFWLGGKVDGSGNDFKSPKLDSYNDRNWRETAYSHHITDKFLEGLILQHFHLDPVKIGLAHFNVEFFLHEKRTQSFSFAELHKREAFNITMGPNNKDNKERKKYIKSIGAIECTLFANGFLSLVIRVKNEGDIRPEELVYLIRHVEAVKLWRMNNKDDIEVGELLLECDKKVLKTIISTIERILSKWKLKLCSNAPERVREVKFGKARSDDSEIRLQDIEHWSRPYVGVLIRGTEDQSRNHRQYISRLIVAAGRSTPAFLTQFNDAHTYLSSGLHDVYGPGESYIFIGRRGWCVYDARRFNHDSFRESVVESTHFVIMAISAAARSRRRFARELDGEGREYFVELDATICGMKKLWWSPNRAKIFRDAFADATTFLSRARLMAPNEDESRLLEAHLLSHTARAAVRRCMDLTSLEDVDKACRDKLSNYSEMLQSNANYQRFLALRLQGIGLLVAMFGITATVIVKLLLR